MDGIDNKKLDKMWEKVLAYEKSLDDDASSKTAISGIIKIIDEVYRECY